MLGIRPIEGRRRCSCGVDVWMRWNAFFLLIFVLFLNLFCVVILSIVLVVTVVVSGKPLAVHFSRKTFGAGMYVGFVGIVGFWAIGGFGRAANGAVFGRIADDVTVFALVVASTAALFVDANFFVAIVVAVVVADVAVHVTSIVLLGTCWLGSPAVGFFLASADMAMILMTILINSIMHEKCSKLRM